jgi:hypothetical protein
MDPIESAPLEDDFSSLIPDAPSNAAMAKLRGLLDELWRVEEALEKYKAIVKRGEARLQALLEDEIPQVLEVECGQQSCGYPDGLKVQLKVDYYANIPSQSNIEKLKDPEAAAQLQERLDKAMEWLEANAPDIIKRKFEIAFGREDQKLADKFERDLAKRKKPVPCVRGNTVHPQTLNAFVRQRIEEHYQLPRDILGVHEKKVAKITRPR